MLEYIRETHLKIALYLSSMLLSTRSFAQRVTQEDIYGPGEGGGDSIFAYPVMLLIAALIIWGIVSNRGFRNGVLVYAGFILVVIAVANLFGKEAAIATCVVVCIALLISDKNGKIK